MIAQDRTLPVITVSNSTVCLGHSIDVTTNSSDSVFEWIIYASLPTAPTASFTSRSFTWTSPTSGTRNFLEISYKKANFYLSLRTYSNCCGWSIPVFQSVTINPLPVMSLTNLSSTYCNNDPQIYYLVASPPGGDFQGSGLVYTRYFSPSSVLPGIYDITYNYTNPVTFCANSATKTTEVYAVPMVTISALNAEYCRNDGVIHMVGNPVGGVFGGMLIVDFGVTGVGQSVTGNDLNVTSVTGNVVNVTYTVTFGTGCVNSAMKSVTIKPSPRIPSITNLALKYCQNSNSVMLQGNEMRICGNANVGSPVGGLFSSNAVSTAGALDPKILAPGTYNVTYIVTNDFNCSNSITYEFSINEIFEVTLCVTYN
jgi:hypothetical protein